MPLGVPSSFQSYDPHPIVVRRAQQAWMEDVDGNRYIDFDMGYGALFAGHAHPLVRKAIERQLDDGTLFVTPCEMNAEVAELLRARYSLPMWRFTNSGTEATMDAIRVARGITGRDKIVKVEGGYHGHHDEVMISMKPALAEAGPADSRTPCRRPPGITPRRGRPRSSSRTTTPPHSSVRSQAATSPRSSSSPVMENIGICMPDDGYLDGVREITRATARC
jgi:glutamate-1-semialdehyde 2,1-aminomutase